MWTAKVTSKNKQSGRLHVHVEFSDGNAEFVNKEFVVLTGNMEEFKNSLRAEIDRLNILDALDRVLVPGPVDLTLPADIPPTDAEKARSAFVETYKKFTRLQGLVTEGVITPDAPEVVDLEAQVKAAYRPEYFGVTDGSTKLSR